MNCCYCERKLTKELLTKEHIVPVFNGGNNTLFNIRACCKYCNSRRGSNPLFIFRFQLQRTIRKNKLHKHFSIDQTKIAIKNTYVIQKYIDENLELLL